MTDWPFDDPPNVAVFTTMRIVRDGAWIEYVSHDADDGTWQFHTPGPAPPTTEEAAVVGLLEIVHLDASICELVDPPLGWRAWRESKVAVWRRAPISGDLKAEG